MPLQQAFIFDPGQYYVRYPEGFRSMCMTYRNACTYAKIFKGKVCREGYPEPYVPLLKRLFGF